MSLFILELKKLKNLKNDLLENHQKFESIIKCSKMA